MERINAKAVREILRVSDDSHIGDIVHGLDHELAKRLIRAGYIIDCGQYVLTAKALRA